jgi:hypothetical protein
MAASSPPGTAEPRIPRRTSHATAARHPPRRRSGLSVAARPPPAAVRPPAAMAEGGRSGCRSGHRSRARSACPPCCRPSPLPPPRFAAQAPPERPAPRSAATAASGGGGGASGPGPWQCDQSTQARPAAAFRLRFLPRYYFLQLDGGAEELWLRQQALGPQNSVRGAPTANMRLLVQGWYERRKLTSGRE